MVFIMEIASRASVPSTSADDKLVKAVQAVLPFVVPLSNLP